ncbi:MAG: hypothetical protein NDF57_01515 [archaeon GBS-70-058]|nr:hypothetical protein [Candidatus Culexarchaeum nevadense]
MNERTILQVISMLILFLGIILLTLEQEIGIALVIVGGASILIIGVSSMMRGVRRRYK